jgi:hypothetical protein
LGYSHDFNLPAMFAIDDKVGGYGPKQDFVIGEVLACMAHSGIASQSLERVKELVNPAIRRVNIVLGDVLPNLIEIEIGAFAEDTLAHAMSLLRSADFRRKRWRAASGLTNFPWSTDASRMPSSRLNAAIWAERA